MHGADSKKTREMLTPCRHVAHRRCKSEQGWIQSHKQPRTSIENGNGGRQKTTPKRMSSRAQRNQLHNPRCLLGHHMSTAGLLADMLHRELVIPEHTTCLRPMSARNPLGHKTHSVQNHLASRVGECLARPNSTCSALVAPATMRAAAVSRAPGACKSLKRMKRLTD